VEVADLMLNQMTDNPQGAVRGLLMWVGLLGDDV